MTDPSRLYGDLAPWWPVISPLDAYEDETDLLVELLERSPHFVRTVLDLGCGGGHAAHLMTNRFVMTLVDISPEMVQASCALNPECEHRVGDMLTLRLDRTFDAVLIHDAIDYMLAEDDLRAAFATAFAHLKPGGALVLCPDRVRETFVEDCEVGGSDADDGRSARYLAWTTDPDPLDTTVRTDYAFLLKEVDDSVRVVHESHVTGLFALQTWRELLADAGFVAIEVVSSRIPGWGPRISALRAD